MPKLQMPLQMHCRGKLTLEIDEHKLITSYTCRERLSIRRMKELYYVDKDQKRSILYLFGL